MSGILDFFVDILSVPAVMVGLAALVGSLGLRRSFAETVTATVKATAGFVVLVAGAVTLVGALSGLEPMITYGFNVQGVIPTNEAIITVALVQLGQATAIIMILGFVFNIVFALITPWKYIFLTGHHSLYMAALLSAAFSTLGMSGWVLYLVGGIVLGLLQVLMPAWAQGVSDKVSGGEAWSIGHFNTLGYVAAGFFGKLLGNPEKSTEDIEFPKSLGFLRDPLVANGVVIFVVFLIAAFAAGPAFINENLSPDQHWLVYTIIQSITFAAGVGIVIYGVRLILAEIIPAFRGISEKLVPNSKPALDIPVVYPYAENAVMIGFITSFVAGVLSMIVMGLVGMPVIVPGLIPHFFLGAGTGVIGNAYGGRRGAVAGAFVNGIIISFGAALLLPGLAVLGFPNTTFGDADFQWVGIIISWIGRLFGAG